MIVVRRRTPPLFDQRRRRPSAASAARQSSNSQRLLKSRIGSPEFRRDLEIGRPLKPLMITWRAQIFWDANHANRIPVLTAFRFGDEIDHVIVHQRLQRASAASAAQSVANSQPVPAEPDWFFRNFGEGLGIERPLKPLKTLMNNSWFVAGDDNHDSGQAQDSAAL